MKTASLTYTVIFNPAETWTTAGEYENWFSKVLGLSGLRAERATGDPKTFTVYPDPNSRTKTLRATPAPKKPDLEKKIVKKLKEHNPRAVITIEVKK